MTKLLEKAFTEASRLPEWEQDSIATMILQELISERHWEESLANSEDALAQLADEALTEHREGRSQILDSDRL